MVHQVGASAEGRATSATLAPSSRAQCKVAMGTSRQVDADSSCAPAAWTWLCLKSARLAAPLPGHVKQSQGCGQQGPGAPAQLAGSGAIPYPASAKRVQHI